MRNTISVPTPTERFREKERLLAGLDGEEIHCRLTRPRYPPGDPGRAKLFSRRSAARSGRRGEQRAPLVTSRGLRIAEAGCVLAVTRQVNQRPGYREYRHLVT